MFLRPKVKLLLKIPYKQLANDDVFKTSNLFLFDNIALIFL